MCVVDWSDCYSGQGVDSLAGIVALRDHDARVGGLIPGLGSFNMVTHQYNKIHQLGFYSKLDTMQ